MLPQRHGHAPLQLRLVQPPVGTVRRSQVAVPPLLREPGLVHHDNPVRAWNPNRRHSITECSAASRHPMTDTSKSPTDEAAQLRSQLDELRATNPAPKLAEAKERVAATVSNVADTVTETVAAPIRQGVAQVRGAVASARRTAAQVSTQKDSLAQRVRSQPFLTLGAAMLTGYVCGRIVR